MRLIDRLVLKDLAGPFLTGLMMFMLLIFAAAYLFPATEMLVKGIKFWTVVRVAMLSLPSVVTQTLPMSMLLAGLMAFGRLSSDREAIAIFAAGISFQRASRAVVLMGAVVSIVAFFWNDWVVPPCSAAYYAIKNEAEKHIRSSDKPIYYPVQSKTDDGMEEWVAIDGGYDAATQTLRRVSITKYSRDPKRRGQPEVVVYCDHARFNDRKGLLATYFDGYTTYFAPDPKTGKIEDIITQDFEELSSLPQNATLGKTFDGVLNAEVTDPNRITFNALRAQILAEREQGLDTRGEEVDLYGKIALPLASLIFGVVGAALGVNTQRGGGKTVGFGMAIFIVFLYWVFYHAMFVAGKNGGLSPLLASFSADIVGAIAGIILTVRASR